tara:strand:- start:6610 stop:6792 length:183 start_codon:yes stop_codon:yes gene_type:complete
MTRINNTFALAALANNGEDATAPIADMIDTLAEAIEAARPHWDGYLVQLTADRLARVVAN